MEFQGYTRPDGNIGIRNHILILPTVACANETCRIIAENLPEAVSLVNQNGCGEVNVKNGSIVRSLYRRFFRVETVVRGASIPTAFNRFKSFFIDACPSP